MSAIFLKVKVKSLAAESRIIRREQDRLRSRGKIRSDRRDLFESLASHRRGVVRREARNSHLAYGYLRGVPYRAMERVAREDPDWHAIERMVGRYGPARHNLTLEQWRKAS